MVITTSEPTWLKLARAEIGTKEAPGDADNPRILQYYADAGHPEVKHDAVAYCAAFCGAILHRAGIKPTGSLMAKSYLTFGAPLAGPKVGCIAVLWRGSPTASTGHVGFVTGFTDTEISLLGGNQKKDGEVCIETFPRTRVLAYRWPQLSAPTTLPPVPRETLLSRITSWLKRHVGS
jgi:uncharacterized protein (TIGR02594 family)